MVYYPSKINIGFQEGSCPLKCKKCFAFGTNAKQKKKIEKMDLDQAKKLIDEIADIDKQNRPYIQPYIFSEPFANKDLKEIFQYCQNKDVLMTFLTNGILVNDEWVQYLVNEFNGKTTISFSLDAVTQETYQKVRGDYQLSQIENTILRLINERKNKDLRIGVNFTIEKENQDECLPFFEKWKNVADAVKFGICIDENREIIKDLKIPFDLAEDKSDIDGCYFLNDIMYIDSNGDVRTCGWDAFGESCLGNVFEKGILGVWNGETRNQLRNRVHKGMCNNDDFCYKCKVKGHHGGYIKEETDEFVIVKNSEMIYFNKK